MSESITCPKCGKVSFNPNDIRERYCGNCSRYHDTMLQTATPEPVTDGEFVLTSGTEGGSTEIWDRGGVSWHKAPLPRRWHRCRVQTRSWFNDFDLVERCACGAIRLDGRAWIERNQRRRPRGT